MIKKYLLYLVRWQLSTPILALCVVSFAAFGPTASTIVANLIGGLIFFWVDRWIFTRAGSQDELWQARSDVVCADCGRELDRGYRLMKFKGYDRSHDDDPEFRCQECSYRKYRAIKEKVA